MVCEKRPCMQNFNQAGNGDADADADADAKATVIALHILRIVELKMANFDKFRGP